jgi:hypothetical protein
MTSQSEASWERQITKMCGSAADLAAPLIPPGRAADPWQPSDRDALLAWHIYTQLRTRIATQELPLRAGVEATALKSLVDLFGIAREAMMSEPRALHVASLVVHCLNSHIRPVTARWHAKMEAGDLANLDERFSFRSELIALQNILRAFAALFGQIAGDPDAIALLTPLPLTRVSEAASRGRIKFGIWSKGQHPKDVDAMNAEEVRLVAARRAGATDGNATEIHDAVGLAISGGGIRSATFALGVTEVLARYGVLKDVDVMSTVSGGGYLGSFISSVLNDNDPRVGLQPDKQPFATEAQVESQAIRYLRNHGKYLSEGGIATLALIVFSAAYGVVMSLLLVAPLLMLLAAIAVDFFNVTGSSVSGLHLEANISRWVWLAFGVSILILSILRNPSQKFRKIVERFAIALGTFGLLLLVVGLLPDLLQVTSGHTVGVLMPALSLPFIVGLTGLWSGLDTRLSRVAWWLMVLFGPLFFLALWLLAVDSVVELKKHSQWLPWILTAALSVYGWLGVNINFASLHLYYRNRLARTYLRRMYQPEAVDPQPLSALNPFHKAPLHLINAAVNLPASRNPELRGRDTDFFIFAKHYCGGPSVGYWPTKEWEARDQHLDLGTAMAISGAAAAPRMGTRTSARYTTLLAMLNVRLGYWIRKPSKSRILDPVPGCVYFTREITGQMHERLPFINVSDGGHIENMGLYELLRRRCRYIVLIDGEADPQHAFGGLLNSIRMAKIDLGVRIEPDLSDLRLGIEPFKRAHFAMANIDYGDQENGKPVHGLLLVIKLALSGNESELLMQFRQLNPTFPHQSTAQQLFSEAQFEAYRALGEHAAEAAFDPLLAGPNPQGAADWLRQLEQRLKPQPNGSTTPC